MDLIKMTRELAAALQQDQRYLNFAEAHRKNDEDKELNEQMQRIKLIQMSYQHEASSEEPNQQKLDAYENEFELIYKQVRENPNMQEFEKAMNEMDALMKYITGILSQAAMGEDPMTCEPYQEHNCGGECSSCSGCH